MGPTAPAPYQLLLEGQRVPVVGWSPDSQGVIRLVTGAIRRVDLSESVKGSGEHRPLERGVWAALGALLGLDTAPGPELGCLPRTAALSALRMEPRATSPSALTGRDASPRLGPLTVL